MLVMQFVHGQPMRVPFGPPVPPEPQQSSAHVEQISPVAAVHTPSPQEPPPLAPEPLALLDVPVAAAPPPVPDAPPPAWPPAESLRWPSAVSPPDVHPSAMNEMVADRHAKRSTIKGNRSHHPASTLLVELCAF